MIKKCHICDKTFSRARNVMKHCINVHLNVEENKSKSISNQGNKPKIISNYQKLKLKSNEKFTFECEICKKSLSSNRALKRHMNLNVNLHEKIKSGQKHECQVCDKTFYFQHSLDKHLIVQHLNIKFTCQKCGQNGFKFFDELKTHLKTKHQEAMILKCDICDNGKKFERVKSLTNHYIDLHLKFGHQCKICLRKLSSRSNLRSHMKVKHSEKLEQ